MSSQSHWPHHIFFFLHAVEPKSQSDSREQTIFWHFIGPSMNWLIGKIISGDIFAVSCLLSVTFMCTCLYLVCQKHHWWCICLNKDGIWPSLIPSQRKNVSVRLFLVNNMLFDEDWPCRWMCCTIQTNHCFRHIKKNITTIYARPKQPCVNYDTRYSCLYLLFDQIMSASVDSNSSGL